MDVQAIYHRARGAAELLEPGDPGYETTTADVPALLGAHDELREALQALYETAHDLVNAPDPDGRMLAGTPRLNAALGRAFAVLHARGPDAPPSTAQADHAFPVGAEQGAPRLRPGEQP